jgi:hypothetical protein
MPANRGMLPVEETLAFTAGTALWDRYMVSFWFMLSILLGSERGDINPTTSLEVAVTICLEMIGCVIFGVIIGEAPISLHMHGRKTKIVQGWPKLRGLAQQFD